MLSILFYTCDHSSQTPVKGLVRPYIKTLHPKCSFTSAHSSRELPFLASQLIHKITTKLRIFFYLMFQYHVFSDNDGVRLATDRHPKATSRVDRKWGNTITRIKNLSLVFWDDRSPACIGLPVSTYDSWGHITYGLGMGLWC